MGEGRGQSLGDTGRTVLMEAVPYMLLAVAMLLWLIYVKNTPRH